MFAPTAFEIDNDRFYYEPRALWSTARVQASLEATNAHPAGYVNLPKEDFRNPSRYPIRITHACVSPVGYAFANWVGDNAVPSQYDACMAGLGRMRMALAFPRRSWIERVNTDLMSFGTVPTAEPGMRGDPVVGEYASGLFGISRWTFPVPYILPRKASIEFILSTIGTYQNVALVDVPASVILHERGGRMLGHARHRAPAALEYADSIPGAGAPWPAGRSPVLPDIFSNFNGLVKNPQGQVFPPSAKWPSSEYNRQLGSRGLPYSEVQGLAVHIDQIAFDTLLNAVHGPGSVAPVSQRIITKARTRDAGTGEQWWRDGAPLSLVTPTMTPAFVHRFEQPFELGPGEGLEVALQAPPSRVLQPADHAPITVAPYYNVGVSFCGYAVVEDNNRKVYR